MANGVALDTNTLEQLLVDGKFDAAKGILNDYINADLPKEVKGAAYVAFVMTYVSVMNKIYDQYNQALDETIAGLKLIDTKEKQLTDRVDAARVKNEIKKLSK